VKDFQVALKCISFLDFKRCGAAVQLLKAILCLLCLMTSRGQKVFMTHDLPELHKDLIIPWPVKRGSLVPFKK